MTENSVEQIKSDKRHTVIRFVCFFALAGAVIILLTNLLTPSFAGKREDSIHKMYEQPADTVQVFCVGGSTLLCGISPDYLFENYGISAYNGCCSEQPTLASLYILKDMMRSQGGTIDTLIVDAAPLVTEESDDKLSKKTMAIAADMAPSLVKAEYILESSKVYSGIDVLEEFIPILKYHSRWNELTSDDFGNIAFDDGGNYAHGQLIYHGSFKSNVSKRRAEKFTRDANETITQEKSFDNEQLKDAWNAINVQSFEKIVDYCDANGISILLLKTPFNKWGDLQHDSVQLIADTHGIEFLDMSLPSVATACGLSYAQDFYDGKHVNLQGSIKISSYVGKYLKEHFDFEDARLNGRYAYMQEDLDTFHDALEDSKLLNCMDLNDYLDLLGKDRYTVFIAIRGEAAEGLDEQTRKQFANLGLQKLANLSQNESYLGILESGICITEQYSADGEAVTIKGSYQNNKVIVAAQHLEQGAVVPGAFEMTSIGSDKSSKASIDIMESEYSENNKGINIAVFNSRTGYLLDHASFDTHTGPARTSDIPPAQE